MTNIIIYYVLELITAGKSCVKHALDNNVIRLFSFVAYIEEK
jgi:hypothetical protein